MRARYGGTFASRGGERIIGIQYWEYEHGDALDLHAFHMAWGLASPPNPYNLPLALTMGMLAHF
jgi:hypothetical protein